MTLRFMTLLLLTIVVVLFSDCNNSMAEVGITFKGFIYKEGGVEYILKDEEASFAFTSDRQKLILSKDNNVFFDTALDINSSWQFDSHNHGRDFNVVLVETKFGGKPEYGDSVFTLNKTFKIGYISKHLTQSINTIEDSCTQIRFYKNRIGFFLYNHRRQILVDPWNVRFRGYNGRSNEVYVYYNDTTYPTLATLANSSNAYLRLLNSCKN